MARSMQDFVDSRKEALGEDVRVDVPVFLPGHGAIGKFGAKPDEPVPGIVMALASIVLQPMRMITRMVKRGKGVYERASLRNYEVVITNAEVAFSPASPLLLKSYAVEERMPLESTPIHFESVQVKMSKLTVGTNVWHVHPEYVGDVRWALRRLAEENPSFDITFRGGEIVEAAEPAPKETDASDEQPSDEEE